MEIDFLPMLLTMYTETLKSIVLFHRDLRGQWERLAPLDPQDRLVLKDQVGSLFKVPR